jgi:hypothetical protein
MAAMMVLWFGSAALLLVGRSDDLIADRMREALFSNVVSERKCGCKMDFAFRMAKSLYKNASQDGPLS